MRSALARPMPDAAPVIWGGYVGSGYGMPTELSTRALETAARTEGLILDPVYTGKAFFGLYSELKQKRELGKRIIFFHTGGIFGLFPKAAELAPLL